MPAAPNALASQSAALVNRARAGDENAMAMLTRIGQRAREGNPRAQSAYAAVQRYISTNPARAYVLGGENDGGAVRSNGGGSMPSTGIVQARPYTPTLREQERRKDPLPRGSLDTLFEPELFGLTVVRACQYKHGLDGCAAVLAGGPTLNVPAVKSLAGATFGAEESKAIFFHGVKYPDPAAWTELAPQLDPPMRRCFAIGQCVGRARRLQAVRRGGSISSYSPVAGWELGE